MLAALRIRHRNCYRRSERESERGKEQEVVGWEGAEEEPEEDRNMTRDKQLKEKDMCER